LATPRNTTIKDIAQRLDLHYTTVSRAVRGHPDVNPETRKRILTTAREMNYFTNHFASNLRSRKSRVIGIIVPSIDHFFFAGILSQLTNMAYAEGYTVMISQTNENPEIERKVIREMIKNRVSGILASVSDSSANRKDFREVLNQGIPLTLFDRVFEENGFSKVLVDNQYGAHIAARHLIEQGRKHIVHLAGDQGVQVYRERLRGYKWAMQEAGLSVSKNSVLVGSALNVRGYDQARELYEKKKLPDAFLCVGDDVAFGVLRFLHEKRIRIPADVAVIGFDNDPVGAVVWPPLTTVDQSIESIAVNTFRLFMDLQKNTDSDRRKIVLKPTLIRRQSA
jgi:LacI family transcriptional regulator